MFCRPYDLGAAFCFCIELYCHSEPVRRLAWESPVLFCAESEYQEIATSAFGLLAMTELFGGYQL